MVCIIDCCHCPVTLSSSLPHILQAGKKLPDYSTYEPSPSARGSIETASPRQAAIDFSAGKVVHEMLKGDAKLVVDVAVVQYIVATCKPLTTPQHPAFKNMMAAASDGKYSGLCYLSTKEVLHRLSREGKEAASDFINHLQDNGTEVVGTCDFWSEGGKALYGITGHGITKEWELKFVLMGAVPCAHASHTGDLVDKLTDKAMQDLGFGDASRVFNFTTDNGSNIIKGLKEGGRTPCFCHTLELSTKVGIHGIEEVEHVFKKASAIVAHFKRSTIGGSRFKESQLRADLAQKKLILMVLTRWRSHHNMAKSVVTNKAALQDYGENYEEDEAWPCLMLDPIEFKTLDQMSSVLQRAADASVMMEGDKYPTIGMTLPVVGMLIASFDPATDVILQSTGKILSHAQLLPCVRKAREAMFEDMKRRWIVDIDDNVKRILIIGSMVDPRAKDLSFLSSGFPESWQEEAIEIFRFNFFTRWVSAEPSENSIDSDSTFTTPRDSSAGGASASTSFSAFFKGNEKMISKPASSGGSRAESERDKAKKELAAYLDMPAIPNVETVVDGDGRESIKDVDILQWWKKIGQVRFPRIAVMARQFLAIPASSATSERVFSFAGLTLSDLRKSLLDGTLEHIMWAKWGHPSIPAGRGDLAETDPDKCE
jgi:hypothetical protein